MLSANAADMMIFSSGIALSDTDSVSRSRLTILCGILFIAKGKTAGIRNIGRQEGKYRCPIAVNDMNWANLNWGVFRPFFILQTIN